MDYTYMQLEVESYVPRLIVPILNLPCEKRFVYEISFLAKYTNQIGYLASSDKVGRTPISSPAELIFKRRSNIMGPSYFSSD